jgi:predicted alpha/beta-fold hydrolase
MSSKPTVVKVKNKNGLIIPGIHHPSTTKDVCLLWIWGMSGVFQDVPYSTELLSQLSRNKIGFLAGHNRGLDSKGNKVVTKVNADGSFQTKLYQHPYLKYTESVNEIELWKLRAIKLGYKNIIIGGHSLGCNRIISYISSHGDSDVTSVILASPTDMVGNVVNPGYQTGYKEMIAEARKNMVSGNTSRLLSIKVWDKYVLTSQMFSDLFVDGCPADNLPILKKPKSFTELASIHVPVLAINGENDDGVIRSLEDDLKLIKEKAINTISFKQKVIKSADHNYKGKEIEFSKEIFKWIESIK